MLTIRLQRAGRKKLPMYRLVAQEHRRTPSSGKVAAYLGSYNPISKATTLDVEKIEFYLKNGAQPSNKVAKLLQANKVKLPDWVKIHVRPEQAKPVVEEPAKPEATANAEEPVAPAEAATEPVAEAEAAAPEESTPEASAEETAVSEAPATEEIAETPIEPEAEPVAEAPATEETPAVEPESEAETPADSTAAEAAPEPESDDKK